MGEIIEFPESKVPQKKLVTGKEIYSTPKPTDRQVWSVCPYLRNLEPCKRCPSSEYDENYGDDIIRGCRALATEACRVVMATQPGPREG